jgi:hypothetical protein
MVKIEHTTFERGEGNIPTAITSQMTRTVHTSFTLLCGLFVGMHESFWLVMMTSCTQHKFVEMHKCTRLVDARQVHAWYVKGMLFFFFATCSQQLPRQLSSSEFMLATFRHPPAGSM